ncbi:hypothetical protein H9N28_09315 [Rhodobacter capsulatus]|uniref:hypothetical protein n=1 Tax=Rhodobacter capsulatus TaxID=1061 RepID=UPI0006DC598E|nr:hypothetical protein [Rhodobacter capsulatus]KQB12739.1 hypothetical protein AP073_06470 [Rhodobacter capsulatus]KQB15343.1 hypothetical protein AP071_14380 [Rhodobacter capsulatus]PZX26324.1 hypothetical protein LY44_01018 [Rhodobacter capsulatus]QNR61817.1 hypothetical protein H9N28_09315 [Rhodobacter capsulatus]
MTHPGIDLRASLAALQAAARGNMAALLAGTRPERLPRTPPARLRFGAKAPLPGLVGGLLSGAAAGTDLRALIAAPDQAGVQLGRSIGATAILPAVLHSALADRGLAHEIGVLCHEHLAERVIFHPGPPPFPRFSPLALAILALAAETGADPIAQALRTALAALAAEADRPGFWDRWLYRRIAQTPGWDLPEAQAVQPLPGGDATATDPAPPPVVGDDWPACWPSLTDCTP